MSRLGKVDHRRAKRALALMALYMLDARSGDEEEVRRWATTTEDFGQGPEETASSRGRRLVEAMRSLTPEDREEALALALEAHRRRRQSDAEALEHAPQWPPHRQPALDRAVLRLAQEELRQGRLDPRIVINEAVELAKLFGGDRSSGFVNAVLDRVVKSSAPRPCQAGGEAS